MEHGPFDPAGAFALLFIAGAAFVGPKTDDEVRAFWRMRR